MKTILIGHSPLEISAICDSAMGRDVQPLFIPDIDVQWQATLMPALRIERLGKCISPKFAMRYVDAIGVVAICHPADIQPVPGALPGWMLIMDSAVTAGHWIACGEGAYAIEMQAGEETVQFGLTAHMLEQAAQAVAHASSHSTLKTGDVIIPPLGASLTVDLRPNMLLQGSVNGQQSLRLKVK